MKNKFAVLFFLVGTIVGLLLAKFIVFDHDLVKWNDDVSLYGYSLIEGGDYNGDICMIVSNCLMDVSCDGEIGKYGIVDINDISIFKNGDNIAVSFGFKNSLDLRLSYLIGKGGVKPFSKRVYSLS